MNLMSELRADVTSGNLFPALSVGLVVGVIGSAYLISVGALVFAGPLAPFLSQGTIMVLFGGFVVCLWIALTSGYRGALSMTAVPSSMVLVVIASTIGVEGDAIVRFVTTATVVIIGAMATGVCFLIIGYFRLSNDPVHPLLRGGRVHRRDRSPSVRGGTVADGSHAGQRNPRFPPGARCAVEMGSGRGLRSWPRPCHKALEQSFGT